MLDHVGVPVSDFERSKRFYEQALSPLGYELIMEPSVSAAGFGRWGKPDFWISQGEPGQAFHIAFAADDRATVDAFHEAAIAAGGSDNGGPGLRPEYHASYYGAFVFDPDGNNIEAVCHGPELEALRGRIPYSPGCVEVEYNEGGLPLCGVLRNSPLSYGNLSRSLGAMCHDANDSHRMALLPSSEKTR